MFFFFKWDFGFVFFLGGLLRLVLLFCCFLNDSRVFLGALGFPKSGWLHVFFFFFKACL